MKILIIEDIVSDIKYYESLKLLKNAEVSFLFLAPDSNYTPEKIKDHVELLYSHAFRWVKEWFAYSWDVAKNFLRFAQFDFYIIDSLQGRGGY